MIESGTPVEDVEVLEYMRAYRLSRELHIPPTAQEDQPAVMLDWLLKIHEAVVRRQNAEMTKSG